MMCKHPGVSYEPYRHIEYTINNGELAPHLPDGVELVDVGNPGGEPCRVHTYTVPAGYTAVQTTIRMAPCVYYDHPHHHHIKTRVLIKFCPHCRQYLPHQFVAVSNSDTPVNEVVHINIG